MMPLTLAAISLLGVVAAGGVWLTRLPPPPAATPAPAVAVPPAAAVSELFTGSIGKASDVPPPAQSEAETLPPEDVIDQSAAEMESMAADAAPAEPPEAIEEASIIAAPNRPLRKAPIAAVTETTAQGPLPRISSGGKTPFEAYSHATPLAVLHTNQPKIALVLGGMGLNARLTRKAIEQLPGDITFGFAPYGDDLQAQVNKARSRGHEILLQVPMEPLGYPGNNPGPHTLLSDALPKENLDALRWHMSRFAGYSGITNYMGARLLGAEDALRPVMREMTARGLAYLEDATVSLTLSPKLGAETGLPMRQASMVIDAAPTAPAIAAALAQLEQEAIANGVAIATGSGLEITIDTVAEWAKTLQEKGILLVPLSAAYKGNPA
jgi:polysaccharide deacetylase 2 family uncharacterized protein YibQ